MTPMTHSSHSLLTAWHIPPFLRHDTRHIPAPFFLWHMTPMTHSCLFLWHMTPIVFFYFNLISLSVIFICDFYISVLHSASLLSQMFFLFLLYDMLHTHIYAYTNMHARTRTYTYMHARKRTYTYMHALTTLFLGMTVSSSPSQHIHCL